MAAYYIDHAKGVYPAAAAGNPWKAEYIAVKGDPIADLVEDLAADATIA
jgi:spore coat protein JC